MHFVFHQHGTEDSDCEVCVKKRGLPSGYLGRWVKSGDELVPVWVQGYGRNPEHNHQKAGESESSLDPLKAEQIDDRGDDNAATDQEISLRPSGEQMQQNGKT